MSVGRTGGEALWAGLVSLGLLHRFHLPAWGQDTAGGKCEQKHCHVHCLLSGSLQDLEYDKETSSVLRTSLKVCQAKHEPWRPHQGTTMFSMNEPGDLCPQETALVTLSRNFPRGQLSCSELHPSPDSAHGTNVTWTTLFCSWSSAQKPGWLQVFSQHTLSEPELMNIGRWGQAEEGQWWWTSAQMCDFKD